MAMVKQQILSPAKINLMLRVLGQRSDGYHELQTCFQLLNWGDLLTFEQNQANGSNQVDIIGFGDLAVKDNLIYQAAQMLKPWAQANTDWTITVNKQIPMGAGLGGGSSNAATTLKFLNEHWQCDLSTFDLLALAVKLGADVPVFILGQGALATGIGDVLSPRRFETPYILLLLPDCHIKTPDLFKAKELVRNQSVLNESSLHDQSFWINDFYPVVLHQFPEIKQIYDQLRNQINLKLSGTGSAMFALYDDEARAMKAQQLASQVCRSLVVESIQ